MAVLWDKDSFGCGFKVSVFFVLRPYILHPSPSVSLPFNHLTERGRRFCAVNVCLAVSPIIYSPLPPNLHRKGFACILCLTHSFYSALYLPMRSCLELLLLLNHSVLSLDCRYTPFLMTVSVLLSLGGTPSCRGPFGASSYLFCTGKPHNSDPLLPLFRSPTWPMPVRSGGAQKGNGRMKVGQQEGQQWLN